MDGWIDSYVTAAVLEQNHTTKNSANLVILVSQPYYYVIYYTQCTKYYQACLYNPHPSSCLNPSLTHLYLHLLICYLGLMGEINEGQ